MGIIQDIDNSPLAAILNAAISEGPGRLMGALGRGIAGLGSMAQDAVGGAIGYASNSLGSAASMGENGPSMTPVSELAQAMQRSPGRFDVGMDQLGDLSAPSFAVGGAMQIGGRSGGLG